MKTIYLEDKNIYLGTAREISNLYWNFSRRDIFCPSHCEFPKFNYDRRYGIVVDFDEEVGSIPVMYVMTEGNALEHLWSF